MVGEDGRAREDAGGGAGVTAPTEAVRPAMVTDDGKGAATGVVAAPVASETEPTTKKGKHGGKAH